MSDEAPERDPAKPVKVGEYDAIADMIKPAINGPDWPAYMVRRRKGLMEVDHERFRPGPARHFRGRKSRQAIEEAELERLVPKALKVLKVQLESPDERVQQSAAIKVLEYARGKPVQKVQSEVAGIQKIVYESAVWAPGELTEAASHMLELPLPLDDDDSEDAEEPTIA